VIVTVKTSDDPGRVQRELIARGLWVRRLEDGARVLFLVEPHSAAVSAAALRAISGVESVALPPSPHPLVDAQRAVDVSGLAVGPGAPQVLMAGPCAVESEAQIDELARRLARGRGVQLLRGGAYKPRSSPYAFQGHGAPALGWLRQAADRHGLRVVTEVMAPADAEPVARVADLLQIGSRNMQCFPLLKAVARTGRPILVKRGVAATVEEWLLAGEYCLHHGAPGVIFCERGIRGFDPSTRNVLDLGAVALLATVYGQPVVVDPSHAAGRRDLVLPLARAALAVGAHGLLVEAHADPGQALSDGPQAVAPEALAELCASSEVAVPARVAAGRS
jgi:3-deoxy-7-phosphoheptulonate synthase